RLGIGNELVIQCTEIDIHVDLHVDVQYDRYKRDTRIIRFDVQFLKEVSQGDLVMVIIIQQFTLAPFYIFGKRQFLVYRACDWQEIDTMSEIIIMIGNDLSSRRHADDDVFLSR